MADLAQNDLNEALPALEEAIKVMKIFSDVLICYFYVLTQTEQ